MELTLEFVAAPLTGWPGLVALLVPLALAVVAYFKARALERKLPASVDPPPAPAPDASGSPPDAP